MILRVKSEIPVTFSSDENSNLKKSRKNFPTTLESIDTVDVHVTTSNSVKMSFLRVSGFFKAKIKWIQH